MIRYKRQPLLLSHSAASIRPAAGRVLRVTLDDRTKPEGIKPGNKAMGIPRSFYKFAVKNTHFFSK